MTSRPPLKIVLPFPPHILSPNSRKHWKAKNGPKNAMKDAGYIGALAHRGKLTQGVNLAISIAFYPPNNRWDVDGMFSAIKSGLDGIALGLGINDKLFRPFFLDVPGADKINPRVEITLNP